MIIENYEIINWNEFKKVEAIIESCQTEEHLETACNVFAQFLSNMENRASFVWNRVTDSWKHPLKARNTYYRLQGQLESMKNDLAIKLQMKAKQFAPPEDNHIELKGLDIFA